jgi:hypothetical protein
MQYDYEKAFNRAIAKFDFNAAHECMDSHGWRWWDHDSTPDIDMLIGNVIRLWDKCEKKSGGNMGSGGFVVGIDEDNCVYISFELSVSESAEV